MVGAPSMITSAVMAVPGQPLASGVIVKVVVCVTNVLLVIVPLMLPVPLAAIPVTLVVLLRVQLNVVPVTDPLNAIVVIGPAQTVCVVGFATAFGVGLTTTVAVIGVPEQPLADGVIVKVTVMGLDVVFTKLPDISPVPLAAIPVTLVVSSRVQLKLLPVTLPDKTIGVMAPEQMVCVLGVAIAFGVGFTVIVNVRGVPTQADWQEVNEVISAGLNARLYTRNSSKSPPAGAPTVLL